MPKDPGQVRMIASAAQLIEALRAKTLVAVAQLLAVVSVLV